MKNKKLKRILGISWKGLKIFGIFLVQLGLFGIFVSVLTFWINQYNSYIEKDNNIKIETENNIAVIKNIILKDVKKEWMYLIELSNVTYKENWNYIHQYYNEGCRDVFRLTSLDINGLNTLLILRQRNDPDPQHSEDIHKFAKIIENRLIFLSECNPKPFRSRIIYNPCRY